MSGNGDQPAVSALEVKAANRTPVQACVASTGSNISTTSDGLRAGRPAYTVRSWSTITLLTGLVMIGIAVCLVGIPDALAPLGPAQTISSGFKFAPAAFSVDRDCNYFRTQAEAQAFFKQAGAGDLHHLDDDGDGIACDLNPWFDLSGWLGK